MKKSKISIFVVALSLFTAGTIFTINSCKKDPCKDEKCNDVGTPSADGDKCKCACNAGYEGEKCETKMVTKFVGSYNVTDNCTSSGTYPITITASSSTVDKILISTFGTYGCAGSYPTVEATVNGNDITIASQSFCTSDAYTVSGSGSMNASGTSLSISYNGTKPPSMSGGSYSCTATCAKQ